ncbi:MAG: glycosyltransferase family 4 protein [Gammaproteobacteria bacterium]|nr:glycosyltransferase family 4 protein [Gammaproteobacteria bacterium]
MKHVVFYAPMKAPNNPRPSGDRELARLFVRALRAAGYHVSIAAQLRSWEGHGNQQRQTAIAARGRRIADALVRRWRQRPPDFWFTYHLYHKAPDWIGPRVCRELGIPYIVAEASVADKQRNGVWAEGYTASLQALQSATAIVCLNPSDRDALLRYRTIQAMHLMQPFCEPPALTDEARAGQNPVPRLIAVAMMRDGDKFESYRQLAAALSRVADIPWQLTVVGDGEKRTAVKRLFTRHEPRVSYLGCVQPSVARQTLATSDLCVWPAHNEALGMALLEAQMCGVPVIAGHSPGVASIVEHGVTGLLTEPGDVVALADALRELLGNPERRLTMARSARKRSHARHSLNAAAHRLHAILSQCLGVGR